MVVHDLTTQHLAASRSEEINNNLITILYRLMQDKLSGMEGRHTHIKHPIRTIHSFSLLGRDNDFLMIILLASPLKKLCQFKLLITVHRQGWASSVRQQRKYYRHIFDLLGIIECQLVDLEILWVEGILKILMQQQLCWIIYMWHKRY